MAVSLQKKSDRRKADEKVTCLKEIDIKLDEIISQVDLLEQKDKLKLLRMLGVGNDLVKAEFYTCYKCGSVKKTSDFYVSTEGGCKSGVTPICKACAESIAMPEENGEQTQPTKETIIKALNYLRKPFLDSIYQSSLLEAANCVTGKTKSNVWRSYVKNMQMVNYRDLTYDDSDFFNGGINSVADMAESSLPKDKELCEMFEKNKSDVIRLLGYEPFAQEKITDQPLLYSQLVGFLDSSEDANDDMMRVSSSISIVRGFLQQAQIDDMISRLIQDHRNAEKNIGSIRSLQETKKNISFTVTKLAQESCISLKHSKNAKKGENTWTGKIKKIKDINLRDGEVNGFDVATARGMKQVIEMSDASIMKQLRLDDSEWSDMVSDQRQMIRKLQDENLNYKEVSRILLRENIDLKDFLQEKGLLSEESLVDLEELFAFQDKNAAPEKEEDNDANEEASE